MRYKHQVVIVLSMLALTSCGDGATSIADVGSFDASVSGDVTGSFSGLAAFGTDNLTGSSNFGISLPDGTGQMEIAIVMDTGSRPAPGTYQLEDFDSGTYGEFVVDEGSDTAFFISESGEVTITSSSAQSVEGTLSFSAPEEFGSRTVQVSATFTAICVANSAISCD